MPKKTAGITVLAALLFSLMISMIPLSAETQSTAPVFYGTQQMTDGDTQKIRFVSLVHSLKGKAVGYTVKAVYQNNGQAVTQTYFAQEMQTDKVWTSLVADGITYTANDLGAAEGFLAVSITGIPVNIGDVYFQVTPYLLYGGEYTYGESRWIKYTNTEFMGAVESPEWSEDSRDISVMSFNVLNAWSATAVEAKNLSKRSEQTASLILSEGTDFVCLQEFDEYYRTESDLISLISSQYAEVSLIGKTTSGNQSTAVTLADQADVWNPIFYDKTQYDVVNSGIFDLTDCGIACYESDYPSGTLQTQSRSLVWAVFQHKTDGQRYVVANLHFSPQDRSTYHPVECAFVIKQLQALSKTYSYPLLVCGDYNSNVNESFACKTLLNAGFLDTWNLAVEKTDVNTEHDCVNKNVGGGQTVPSAAPKGTYANSIDHVLTLSKLCVTSYEVITYENVLDLSDHCPTVVHFYAEGQNELEVSGDIGFDEPGVAWRG